MRTRTFIAAGLATALVASALVSCGSDGTGQSGASGNKESVQLTATNFAFAPTILSAKAGQSINITLKNQDSVEHNFSISSLNVSSDVEKAGARTITFTPSQAGTLEFFCKYHKGTNKMVGTLNVSAASTGGTRDY